MKRNYILFAGLAAVAASGYAATDQLFFKGESPCLPLAQLQPAHKSIAHASAQTVSVKFVLSMDSEQYSIDEQYSPFAFNADYYFMGTEWVYDSTVSGYTCQMEMPAGSYDFVAQFKHLDAGHAGGYDHSAWVIKEAVNVAENPMVTLNPAEAVNRISFVSVMPNGEEMVTDKGRFTDSRYTYELVEAGNVKAMAVLNVASHRDYGMFNYLMANPSYREASDAIPQRADGPAQLDVYVNNVSDKYEFKQVRMAPTADGELYVVAFQHYGSTEPYEVVTNDATSYFEIDGSMASTPIIDNAAPETYTFEYSVTTGATLEGGRVPEGFQGVVSATPKEHIYVSSGIENADYPLSVISFSRRLTNTDTWKAFEDATAWIYLTDAEHSLISAFPQEAYAMGEMNQSYGRWYPGHPGIGIELKDAPQHFSTAPFMLMSYSEMAGFSGDDDMMNFGLNSYSQTLEARYSDQLAIETTIHYNGEEVLQGMDLDWEWPFVWGMEPHEPGEYVVTTTNTNFTMGDMQGLNKAQMCFDNSRADYFPPAIQAFQIRNVEGAVTSKFNTADEAELHIVGSDFNIVKSDLDEWGTYSMWYNYDPAELMIEVAPHGTELFTPVTDIQPCDETYWGFGQYWVVSLQEVAVDQQDQWFDVRVTLTDPSGNYQTQLFSPAFQVEMPTKIQSVATNVQQNGKSMQNKTIVIRHDGKQYNAFGMPIK